MKLITISEAFDIIQGHQITDEEIYLHSGCIPIYTANNIIKGYWHKFLVDDEFTPCISYPTKGNKGEAYLQTSKFDANNTAVLITKPEYEDQIDLAWFIYKLRPLFLKVQTNKSGVSYLNKELVGNLEISIPSLNTQILEREQLKRVEEIRNELQTILLKIVNLEEKHLDVTYDNYQTRQKSVKNLFEIISGNSGITEEYIYSQSENFNEYEPKFLMLTGSVSPLDNNVLINELRKPKGIEKIRTYVGECIHIVRKGKAGVINYFDSGRFTLNDDAYILIKKDTPYELDLKWFYFTHKYLFKKYSTNSDNGTWSKTSFLKHARIDIPSLKEQKILIADLEQLEILKSTTSKLLNKINNIFSKDLL